MRYFIAVLALALVLVSCSSGDDGDEVPADDGEPPVDVGTPPDSTGPPPGDGASVQQASALFVLGDSLSDVGNAAGLADYLLNLLIQPPTVGLCNPEDVLTVQRPCDDLFYRQSRVSDGPVAVEHLAAHFGLAELVPSLHVVPNRPMTGTNYAVASAKARDDGPEDLSRQVDMLLLDHGLLDANALYVVMIGGNDAIDALQAEAAGAEDAAQTSAEIVTSAAAAIGTNVERLLDFGARRLVIANVPDLATLPAVRVNAHASGDEAAMLAAASAVSERFHDELAAVLDEIEASGKWLTPVPPLLLRFDLRASLQAVQQSVAARGGNGLDACFDSEVYRQSPTAERVFHPDCAPVAGTTPRFDEFVFWDGIHPTGAAHAAIGAALIDVL